MWRGCYRLGMDSYNLVTFELGGSAVFLTTECNKKNGIVKLVSGRHKLRCFLGLAINPACWAASGERQARSLLQAVPSTCRWSCADQDSLLLVYPWLPVESRTVYSNCSSRNFNLVARGEKLDFWHHSHSGSMLNCARSEQVSSRRYLLSSTQSVSSSSVSSTRH